MICANNQKSFVRFVDLGVPENAELRPELDDTDRAVIIGMGNVALDCARILLSPIDQLAKTDITEVALETLRKSRIRHVVLVGRRGPMQVAFTIKEFRELTKLNNVQSRLESNDFKQISTQMIESLDRPRKRLTELILKTVKTTTTSRDQAERFWYLKFWRRPKQINGQTKVESVDFEETQPKVNSNFLDENLAVETNGKIETIPCGLVIKSIGYYGIQVLYFLLLKNNCCLKRKFESRLIHGYLSIVNGALFLANIVESMIDRDFIVLVG